MTSDAKIFWMRGLGRLLILAGFLLSVFLPFKMNSFLGLIPGLAIMLCGIYLTSKLDGRRGHLIYDGGKI